MVIIVILFGQFIITSLITLKTTRRVLMQGLIEEKLPLISDKICSGITSELLPYIIVSQRLANDHFIRDWVINDNKNSQELYDYLENIEKEYGASTCFAASDKTRLYYNSDRVAYLEAEGFPAAQWYYDFRKSGKDYEINKSNDVDDTPTVFINAKITDDKGNFAGIAGLGMEFRAIPEILKEYDEDYNKDIYFLNSQGILMASSNQKAEIMENVARYPVIKRYFDEVVAGKIRYFEYEKPAGTFMVISSYIPELGWWLMIEQKESEAIAETNNLVFSNGIVNLFSILLTLLLVVLAISKYNKRLRDMATTDPLTGIGNRQVFEYMIDQSLARLKREREPLSLMLLDLDNFKVLNDTLGHLKGDNVLKKTAKRILRLTRASDVFCRWGGEEFVILLHNCELKNAQELAERIRTDLEKSDIVESSQIGKLTVSIGVTQAAFTDDSDSLIRRADKALYSAKDAGRNCVMVMK